MLRKKGLEGMSLWVRILASGRVNRTLREQGFVESQSECRFCKKKSAGDAVNKEG